MQFGQLKKHRQTYHIIITSVGYNLRDTVAFVWDTALHVCEPATADSEKAKGEKDAARVGDGDSS